MTNYSLDPELFTPVTDLSFTHPDKHYKAAFMIGASIGYIILMGLAPLLLLTDEPWLCPVAEGVIAVAFIINLMIIPKACRFKGYALREHDISYRKGVFFPKVTTIPYSRIQQVALRQNPVFKLYGLYSVELTNGAQAEDAVVIQGLTKENAEQLKSIITDRLSK